MNEQVREKSSSVLRSEFERAIYECLDDGIKLNSFPRDLEAMYMKSNEKARNKRFVLFGIAGIIFYDLFLIGDKAMLPDVFNEAVIIRLFIATPLMILFVIGMLLEKISSYADFIAGSFILLASVSLLYLLLITNHPNVNNYHTGLIIVIVVANIGVRLRFRYAVFYSLLIFLLFVFAVNNITLMNQETVSNSIMVFFTIICFTLVGNYQVENENRINYLNSLLRQIDAAKLEESNKQLKIMSISDGLTGIANRRYFDASLETEWMACCRSKKALSLILIDIDYFKEYNDNYGHQKGDECIQLVARRIQANAKRPRDVVARYGGEEFVILSPEIGIEGAISLAEQIRLSVEDMKIIHKFSKIADVITISLGVATITPSTRDGFFSLVGHADSALYEAKSQGRNKVCLHPESCRI